MKKTIIFLILLSGLAVLTTSPALAKKKLSVGGQTGAGGNVFTVSPRLRGDHLALNIYFGGLNLTNSVSYTLSYTSSGIAQGVAGTIKPAGNSISRQLLFGTCSKNVCRYHQNITDMRLVVTSSMKSGKKVTKSFRIKP